MTKRLAGKTTRSIVASNCMFADGAIAGKAAAVVLFLLLNIVGEEINTELVEELVLRLVYGHRLLRRLASQWEKAATAARV